MRLTMKKIKMDAANTRAKLLKELVDNDYTITELAIIHKISNAAMCQKIKKARNDILKKSTGVVA